MSLSEGVVYPEWEQKIILDIGCCKCKEKEMPNKDELYIDSEEVHWRWREELNSWAYDDGVDWIPREFPFDDEGVVSWGVCAEE